MRVSAPVLQRWHLEVVLLGGSALRLCVALARSGQPVAAAVLAALTLASLWAELQYNAGLLGACHGCLRGLWSYTTRPALSQGISQGVLAVPSLLAALLVVDPYGEVCSTQTHVRAVKDLHSNI